MRFRRVPRQQPAAEGASRGLVHLRLPRQTDSVMKSSEIRAASSRLSDVCIDINRAHNSL